MKTVDELIMSANTKFEEIDRAWLSALSEEMLAKITPKEVSATAITHGANTTAKPKDCECAQKIDGLLSNDDREALSYGKQALAARRTELVGHITANGNDAYSAEELNAMGLDALEKLGKAINAPAPVADFSLRPTPAGNAGNAASKVPEPLGNVTINYSENKTEIN